MEENFESKVARAVERLQLKSPRELEREVAQKRTAWYAHRRAQSDFPQPPTPRQAFECLFLDYMGLSEADLPIVSETSTEIVWHSLNPCATLEAAARLGLDTRQICRDVYEKSTQALVSQLDPQLRFLRNYAKIRPHANYCEEKIVLVNFEEMINLALEEARLSKQDGNRGYGAVVVLGGRVIGKAHDTARTERDPSLHAEVNAIRQAVQALDDTNLSGAILFSTCEPCAMCSSLAVWANLTTLVYGISIEETAQMGKARIRIAAQEVVDRSPGMFEVIGGVLREECRLLYV